MQADVVLGTKGVRIERVELGDSVLPGIVALCRRTLGWTDADPDDAFFRWKHIENPAGVSPVWLARDGDRVIGLRVMMRWRLEQFGRPIEVVRAVDTATDPDYQGRGIFGALTEQAIDALASEGLHGVFNTPNGKSLPGYQKLGWRVLGRAPIVGLPLHPLRAVGSARRRDAAARWAMPTTAGEPVAELLPLAPLGATAASSTLQTQRSGPYLAWRYRFEPLGYRALALRDDPSVGVVIFRVRQRGALRELSLCEVLLGEGTPALVMRDIVRLARDVRADVIVAGAASRARLRGMLPLPGLGPVLTWRTLASPITPSLADLSFGLGDLELF